MMRKLFGGLARAVATAMLVGAATMLPVRPGVAADLGARVYAPPQAPPSWFINEVRLGALGQNAERESVDVNVEVLTRRLAEVSDPFWQLFVPRLHVGATFNTIGYTNLAYAGFTWSYDILPKVFFEASLGGAYNDGKTGDHVLPPNRVALGCHGAFRESATLGYRFDEHWSIMAIIDHASHADLCGRKNYGVTHAGLRLGYSF